MPIRNPLASINPFSPVPRAVSDRLSFDDHDPQCCCAPETIGGNVMPGYALDRQYAFLRQDPLPPAMVRVALEMLGTLETPGTEDNPVIVG
ncbi:MAG: hypothetical protein DI547_03780 [Sphingobium sp.]|nr:MAG: hypothetical protein DI547_03780 [Sphingobium sp.]